MIQTLLRFSSLILALTLSLNSFSQCSNNNTFWTDITPAGPGFTEYSGCMYAGEYCTVQVCTGANYTFSTCGEGYDTQITLYSSTGTYLAYDDDYCAPTSLVDWTSTFTGTVYVLLDEYNCISNDLCTELTCTQNTACGGGCFVYDVYADQNGCVGSQDWLTFYVDFDGGCYVYSMWVTTDGNNWVELVLDPFTHYSMDPIEIYFNFPNTVYDFYFELSDGSTSDIYFYETANCGGSTCTSLDSEPFSAGCLDYFGTLEEAVDFYFYYNGSCTVEGMYLGLSGDVLDYYDLSVDGLTSGDFTGFFLFADNSLYEYYYILSDGTVSSSFFYFTGTCEAGCNDAVLYLNPDCFGGEIAWEIQDLFGNIIYEAPYGSYADGFPNGTGLFFSDLCLDPGCYYFNIYDSYGDGMAGAQYTSCDLDGHYYMTDGNGNVLFESTTANYGYGTSHFFCVSEGGCSNLDADAIEGTCSGGYLPFDISMYFNGGCTVTDVCISEDGGLYTCYDVSGYGLISGDAVVYNIGMPDSYYYYYYVLSDGTESPEFFFQNGSCDEDGFICDCLGTQHTAGVLTWLGDDFADDGTYEWNGQPVNFDCATWGYDCGDIYTDGFYFDPYGTCSGNLPPGNGCIVDESCNLVYFEIVTDCYPGETSMAIFNEFGDLVYDTGLSPLVDEYTTYAVTLCLPTGCYTYAIYDSFGDGLSTLDCAEDGSFGIYDGNDFSLIGTGPAAFGDAWFIDFCVGPDNNCTNLDLSIEQVPCQSDGIELYPEFSLNFDFNGNCTVDQLCWSEDGGPFTCSDVSAFNWGAGDTGFLTYTTPGALYSIYYVLDDGTYSPLFYWLNGNCDNEITICDCDGTQHTWGVLSWLGDGFADNGFYDWAGQPVNFNCAMWGYDCDDIDGAPNIDPYGVCLGGLPPNNGCDIEEEILGCTDPLALNYNPFATINDGSCIYSVFEGCTDIDACNYNPDAMEDNGTCEYVTCAGCTDDEAINYDPTATLEDGSCIYEEIEGCTDDEALNYNPLASVDDGSCVFSCVWPEIVYDTYCVPGNTDEFFISVDVNSLGNGAPYTLTNSNDDTQVQLNFLGVIELGPFDNDDDVLVQVVSNTLDGCFITSPILTDDCSSGIISGCTDELATNYYADATADDGSCEYDFEICDCDQAMFSPAARLLLGDGDPNTGVGSEPNFDCLAWGYDCGDIDGAPDEDPYNVCDGELPGVLIATETGCPVGVDELTGSGISLYPNPNNGHFVLVNGLNTSQVTVYVYNSTGQVAAQGQYNIPQRSSHEFDLSHLAQGTYYVSVISGSYITHEKLVIQK